MANKDWFSRIKNGQVNRYNRTAKGMERVDISGVFDGCDGPYVRAIDYDAAVEKMNELARLLSYAAKHSSVAPLMNDAWREDALAILKDMT